MPLPKLDQPLFETTLPSTQKKVKFRPFTVKEEKILLVAQESKDLEQIILAIKQIITNCVPDVNVDDIAMFDVEWLLINIRAKDSISVKYFDDHNKIIKLNDQYSIQMKYPNFEQLKKISNINDRAERSAAVFDSMMQCIDTVFTEDDVMRLSDFSDKEVQDFLDSLSSKNVEDIKHFFETIPLLRYEKEYTNSNGNKKTFVMEGLESFFM